MLACGRSQCCACPLGSPPPPPLPQAAKATLEVIVEEDLMGNAVARGAQFVAGGAQIKRGASGAPTLLFAVFFGVLPPSAVRELPTASSVCRRKKYGPCVSLLPVMPTDSRSRASRP